VGGIDASPKYITGIGSRIGSDWSPLDEKQPSEVAISA
jgi:hypothetical protein